MEKEVKADPYLPLKVYIYIYIYIYIYNYIEYNDYILVL